MEEVGFAGEERRGARELLGLGDEYRRVRAFSEELCRTLEREDYVVQSMPFASPTKWHLAHVSWFFETFILKDYLEGYRSAVPGYGYLFNSYYNAAGPQFRRDQRGLISRPTVEETYLYRRTVDEGMSRLFERAERDERFREEFEPLVELGLNHEQQHQELLLTDLKHLFSKNPLRPVYRERRVVGIGGEEAPPLEWVEFEEGIYEIGHSGEGFCYDNELPRHREFLERFALGSRLVTCGEYLEFIEDGGYERPEFWLSLGWQTVNGKGWRAPLYWELAEGEWHQFTLSGFRPVEESEPVSHVSYFEADAFARWSGARLVTEAEWEVAASGLEVGGGNFVEEENWHPRAVSGEGEGLRQMYGDLWEWTGSAYRPYPGYQIPEGAIGEYNGKFMSNQMVLRGGSCATSADHIRASYRNFFQPDKRWQFSGIRLARDL